MEKPMGAVREQGQILVWVLLMLGVMGLLVGMIYEGGRMFRAWRRLRMAADAAAFAAAQWVDPDTFQASGRVVLRWPQAQRAAQEAAALNAPGAACATAYVNPLTGKVVVRCYGRIRGLLLLGEIRLAARGEARPAFGARNEGE
ncbi:MAG: hypothetical protein C4313_11440 [Thermoflexus sp.]